MLDGAGIGIEYYIKPDPKKLLDLNVWKDAAGSKKLKIFIAVCFIKRIQIKSMMLKGKLRKFQQM